jgi:hypothetical protein
MVGLVVPAGVSAATANTPEIRAEIAIMVERSFMFAS